MKFPPLFWLSLVFVLWFSESHAAEVYTPDVRVSLTNAPVEEATLEIAGSYRIQPLGKSTTLQTGAKLSETTVVATRTGFKIGNREVRGTVLEIVVGKSPAIWVNDHQYRGSVRLLHQGQKTFEIINMVPLPSYLASVVNGEMSAKFPTPSRQAQIIAARTYVVYQMERKHPRFDVYATTRSQHYPGYQYRSGNRRLAGETAESRELVQETAGIVCTWQGKIFCTYYSAVCGGKTTPGKLLFTDAMPPLREVNCDWCKAAKLYRWKKSLAGDLVLKKVREILELPELKQIDSLKPVSGKLGLWILSDGRTGYPITTEQLETVFGGKFPSPTFDVRVTQKSFEIHGRGHGHGVGLCQWGANGLGNANRTAFQIIQFYYPGSVLMKLDAQGKLQAL